MMQQKITQSDGYKQLIQGKISDIKQSIEELSFFKELRSKEMFGNTNIELTTEIIRNLERRIDDDKADYRRLKDSSRDNNESKENSEKQGQ